jgi:two-component system, NtrC family, response regulator AtoC
MHILLVDDDELERRVLARSLETGGRVKVDAVASAPAALDRLAAVPYDAIVVDLVMKPIDGIEFTRRVRKRNPSIPIVVLTAGATVERAVEAMRAGATDFVPKPVHTSALLDLLRFDIGEVPLREELEELRRSRSGTSAADFIVGAHPALDVIRTFAERVAHVPEARVLITGESGTGKSYLARAVHALSQSSGRFVEVSCATLPPALIESELFGHEKGAFTDAKAMKRGLVELASGGTLFLDEIGALPLDMQSKLLVFLESRQIRRVGGNESISANARVIAATNEDLRTAAREGRFRGDLLYRLDVASIRMPPLREMPTVVLELAQLFARDLADQFKRPVATLSPAACERLQAYPWPGNARELRNVIERALIFHEGGPLDVETPDFQPEGLHDVDALALPRGLTLEEVERRYILDAMADHDGDLSSLAARLGISRKTLWDKRRRYGMNGADGRPADVRLRSS